DDEVGLDLPFQVGADPGTQQVQRDRPRSVAQHRPVLRRERALTLHPDRSQQLASGAYGDHHAAAQPVLGGGLDEQRLVGGAQMREDTLALQQTTRGLRPDRKSTRLNSSHVKISYAVFSSKK